MKFGQFISYCKKKKKKKKKNKKNLKKNQLFVFVKNLAQAVLENEIFEASYLFT